MFGRAPFAVSCPVVVGRGSLPTVSIPLRRSFNSTFKLGSKNPNYLSDREYRKYELLKAVNINYNTKLFTFGIPLEHPIPLGKHISLRGAVGSKHVVKPYTPIPPNQNGQLNFLIKLYPEGQMSSVLKNLKEGDYLEALGPIGNVEFKSGQHAEIGLIAGGTGIAPIYQIVNHLLSDPNDNTIISLIYANNTEEDILLRSQLESLSNSHTRFKVHHLLKEASKSLKSEVGLCNRDIIKKYLNTKSLIMICGPPKMEEYVTKELTALGVPQHLQTAFTHSATTHVNVNSTPHSVEKSHKEITMEEVAKHDKEKDCWFVIEDKVYDISAFVDQHPGGFIILDGAGKDATTLFTEDFPHSEDAKDELKKLQIGILKK